MENPSCYEASAEAKPSDRETGTTVGVDVGRRQSTVTESCLIVADEKSVGYELSTLNVISKRDMCTRKTCIVNIKPFVGLERYTLSVHMDQQLFHQVRSLQQNQVSTNSCGSSKKRPAVEFLDGPIKRLKIEEEEELHYCNYESDGVCDCTPSYVKYVYYVSIDRHPRVAEPDNCFN